MILACLLLSASFATREEPTTLNVVSQFWGIGGSCSIVVTPFKSLPGVRSVKNDHLLLDGRRVWLWSLEDMPPKNVVTSITLDIGGRRLAFPRALLEGLVDLHFVQEPTLHHVSASLYVDRKRDSWALAMWFADGGASFSATFSGTSKSRTITREIYRDVKILVEKCSAQGSYVKGK